MRGVILLAGVGLFLCFAPAGAPRRVEAGAPPRGVPAAPGRVILMLREVERCRI